MGRVIIEALPGLFSALLGLRWAGPLVVLGVSLNGARQAVKDQDV
jgi:hypothetical protein